MIKSKHILQNPFTSNSIGTYTQLYFFKRESGFTLIELMLSLVLGLLISAGALHIFYTSSVNCRRQEAS